MEKMRFNNDLTHSDSDHRLILVDFPPRQQGIAAALRRAFAAAHAQPTDGEFDRLLAKLH